MNSSDNKDIKEYIDDYYTMNIHFLSSNETDSVIFKDSLENIQWDCKEIKQTDLENYVYIKTFYNIMTSIATPFLTFILLTFILISIYNIIIVIRQYFLKWIINELKMHQ